MNKLKIALLAGGDSSEREIALNSAQQIASALDTEKYDVKVIDLHHRNMTYTDADGAKWEVDKNDFSLTVAGEKTIFEYALIIIHGTPGEDGKLQGYLDMMASRTHLARSSRRQSLLIRFRQSEPLQVEALTSRARY